MKYFLGGARGAETMYGWLATVSAALLDQFIARLGASFTRHGAIGRY